jgi:hypothetical protein
MKMYSITDEVDLTNHFYFLHEQTAGTRELVIRVS